MSLARNAGFCGEPNPLASPTSARMTSVERPHRRQLGAHLDPRVGPGPLVVLGVEWPTPVGSGASVNARQSSVTSRETAGSSS